MRLFSDTAYNQRSDLILKNVAAHLAENELLVICSGVPLKKPGGLDQTYEFLPHPIYFWLTGHRRPEGIVAFTQKQFHGEFQRNLSSTEIVWEGDHWNFYCEQSLQDFEKLSSQFTKKIYLGRDELNQTPEQKERALFFHILIDQVRRKKDFEEVQLIRDLADLALKGYQVLAESIRPNLTERQLQLIYENAVLMAGAEKMPYGSIVGAGENAAILHAVPGPNKLKKNDLVLIDAGADIQDYCVDITRVFPVSGKFSSRQQEIYDLVLLAQLEAFDLSRAGNQWRDIHLATAQVIAEGLKDLGIFKASVSEVIETGAIAIFYPHGVGHLVGLKVRDTGMLENKNPKRYAGANLRVDLKLEENFCLTIEPGCYFSRAFIFDQEIRKKFKDQIKWDEAEKWIEVGGVRLEDDILIKKGQPEILTQVVPK